MLAEFNPDKPLPPKIEDALKVFLKRTPPERLSRTVRTLLMEYLLNKHDFLPPDFHIYLDDLANLFALCDQLDTETKGLYSRDGEGMG